MKLLPYTIHLGRKTYTGYLGTSDTSDPPTRFFRVHGFVYRRRVNVSRQMDI
jgi:hypothetical protein